MALWIAALGLSALVVGYAGWRLTKAVDIIADKTGIGRAFLGMILVATVTSLPELSTGVSAAAFVQEPSLAVGDVVGSCMFNLLLFVLADVTSRRRAFYASVRPTHTLTAVASIVLLATITLALMAPSVARPSIGHVGVVSIALAVMYFTFARLLYRAEVRASPAMDQPGADPGASLRGAALATAVAGVAVMAAGSLIAVAADQIAERAGLSRSFVGVLFVGAATSLPELAAVMAAIRINANDLAAGNLLGSNMFNVLVLAVDDLAYLNGPILAEASPGLGATALVAIVMTCAVALALNFVRKSAAREAIDGWTGAILLALFAFNVWLVSAGAAGERL